MVFLWFVVGLFFGSFYLVLGTRLPKDEDVLISRSRCDHCKHVLKWYNLIPVLSFIWQRGKCSYCHQKISKDHFWVEIATGLLFATTYLFFPFGYNFLVGLIISSMLIVIFVSDFKYMVILDSTIIISSILIIGLKIIYYDINALVMSIASGLAMFLVMYVVSLLGKLMFKKDALGGGDIKLAFVIGLCLGFRCSIIALILSTFLALPYAVASVYLKEQHEFPYGPFLAGALFIVFYNYDKFMLLFSYLFI